jgi:acyl carrier protein
MRSLDESKHIVAQAIRACSLPSPPADKPLQASSTFVDLGFDSLAFMEFCIAIQGETGIELSVGFVGEMGSPDAVARYLSELS